jgi:hypothetical protein
VIEVREVLHELYATFAEDAEVEARVNALRFAAHAQSVIAAYPRQRVRQLKASLLCLLRHAKG